MRECVCGGASLRTENKRKTDSEVWGWNEAEDAIKIKTRTLKRRELSHVPLSLPIHHVLPNTLDFQHSSTENHSVDSSFIKNQD